MSKPRLKKALYVFAGTLFALLVLAALSIALIPTVSQVVFKHWLEQQQLQGEIGQIDLSLHKGILTVLDAEIRDNKTPLLKLGKLQVQVRLRDLFDRKVTIEHVELANTRLQLQQDNGAMLIAGIRLNQSDAQTPPATTQQPANSKPWTIQLQQLDIANLDTCLSTNKSRQPLQVCNHLGKLSWAGIVSLLTNNPDKLKASGNFAIGNLALSDEKQQRSLLRFDSLELTNIAINGVDSIKLDSLGLRHLAMLPNQSAPAKGMPTLGFNSLQINTVSLHHLNAIDIASLSIDDVTSYIRLKADNRVASLDDLAGFQTLQSGPGKTETKTKSPPANKNSFHIRIGKIALSTTKPLILQDAHTQPATTHRVDHFAFSLGAIDSDKPTHASDLAMHFKYGKYGEVKLKGSVLVFAPKPTLNLHASIVGLNLNRVSPYLRKLLQHKIKSGQLDAQVAIKVDQGKLDSQAKLTLNKFYVNKLSQKEKDPYQKDLGIPLTAALSLLRDKNDNINIELPVTGDVENPDFSLNDIIATVSAKAIKVAIVNYYATLGLLKIVGGAIDLMTALRFEPLLFSPGKTDLSESARTALDKFASMLQERPQVHLVVCGHATLADQRLLFPAPKQAPETTTADAKPAPLTEQQLQQLNKLALARGDQVKQYLVEQKGVAANRLIQCNPEYEAGDEQSPNVELHI
jgi:hypothetical protein